MPGLIDRVRTALALRIAPRPRAGDRRDARPPGGFSWGTQWIGGPTYADAFNARRSPTPYQLVERYGRIIYAMAERNKNAVTRLPLRLYVDGSRAQGGRPRRACDPVKVSRSGAERFVRAGMVSPAAVAQVYEVRTHPMLTALHQPDPQGFFDCKSLIGLMVVSMDILGGGHLVPEGGGWDWRTNSIGGGPPEHFWVLYSQYVIPVRQPGSPLIESWQYFRDRIPFENALWFRQTVSLRDPYGAGFGPAYAGEQYQDQEGKFIAWYDQFFSGARPTLVASPKDAMMPPGEDVRKRHEQDLNRRHGGGNAGNAIVTNGAYEYTPINYPPTDEGGKLLAEYDLHRLASIFGQPPTYYTVDTNLANLQAADEQHARNGVEPRCWAIAGRLTRFVQRFDPRLFFAFDPAIQEDSESKERVISMRLASGRTTINQENEEERWPAVPWGNVPLLDRNLVPADLLIERAKQELEQGKAAMEQAAIRVANESRMTEFQTSEEPEAQAEPEPEPDDEAMRALGRLGEGLMRAGNPYHDKEGHFTNPAGVGHATPKEHHGKRLRKKRKKRPTRRPGHRKIHGKSGKTLESEGPGGGGGDRKASGHRMTAKEKADRIKKGKPLEYASEKARRAAEHQNKTDGRIQEYTKNNESVFAKRMGGESFPDNGPTDVELDLGGKRHGIELKTVTHGANDKITMKASAIARKVEWEKEHGTQMHTVTLDHRDRKVGGTDNSALYSGHEIYYKRGVGSFRIAQMHKVRDEVELKRLMVMKYEDLPPAAQGPIRGTKH